jgi:hypothetical protein
MEADWSADRVRLRFVLHDHPQWSVPQLAQHIGRSASWVRVAEAREPPTPYLTFSFETSTKPDDCRTRIGESASTASREKGTRAESLASGKLLPALVVVTRVWACGQLPQQLSKRCASSASCPHPVHLCWWRRGAQTTTHAERSTDSIGESAPSTLLRRGGGSARPACTSSLSQLSSNSRMARARRCWTRRWSVRS